MFDSSYSELAAATFWAMTLLSLKAVVLAAGVWGLLRFCRIEEVATRHSLWVTAMIGVLLLAPLGLVVPWVEIPSSDWNPFSSNWYPAEKVNQVQVQDVGLFGEEHTANSSDEEVATLAPQKSGDSQGRRLEATASATGGDSSRAVSLAALPAWLGLVYWLGVCQHSLVSDGSLGSQKALEEL